MTPLKMLMETCTSDVLVGLKEVVELLLERVDQGVVGAVEEEGLHAQDDEEDWQGRERKLITGVEGSWAASLSIDIKGVIPVPPPMNTCISFP